jgi:hypothetical protein
MQARITDFISSLSHFLVETLPVWAWENKFWLIVLIPLIGAIALVKFLWD